MAEASQVCGGGSAQETKRPELQRLFHERGTSSHQLSLHNLVRLQINERGGAGVSGRKSYNIIILWSVNCKNNPGNLRAVHEHWNERARQIELGLVCCRGCCLVYRAR